jgi:hypothetical protein
MVKLKTFLATTDTKLTRAEIKEGEWQVSVVYHGERVNCIANDPHNPNRVFAGTQNGILVSDDSGLTWKSAGLGGIPVKSLAISPHTPELIYAGSKPVSLYASKDSGKTWLEYEGLRNTKKWWWFSPAEPPDWRAYVMALTVSPTDPDVIMAGIELGGVLRSNDGGRSWSKHPRGAVLDCHSIKFHPTNGQWVYEGGGGGAAFSQDGGITWRKPKKGLKKKYGWMVAADPSRPEVWYISASGMPNMLRGEFAPPAHVDGRANATIYRSVGGTPWEPLSGGLPEPLNFMPYALIIDPGASGHLYAGLSNGDVWHTQDYGDAWEQLPVNLGGIHSTMIMLQA